MRKRMAKRKRREILRRGATILSEGWIKDDNGRNYRGKDRCYEIEVEHCGWNSHSAGRDELESIGGALLCVKLSEEEPRNVDDYKPAGNGQPGTTE